MIIKRRYYTSISYRLNARIGKFRKDLADRFQDKFTKWSIDKENADSRAESNPGIKNWKIQTKLMEEARNKYSAPTYFNQPISNTVVGRHKRINLKSKDIASVDVYAHELGHLMNDKKDRFLTRKGRSSRDDYDRSILTASSIKNVDLNHPITAEKKSEAIRKLARKEKINELRNTRQLDTGIGLRESFRRMLKGNSIIREEKDATRNGLKILKNNGVDKTGLRIMKNRFKDFLQTYKEGAKIHVLSPIQNKIQIPSRRRK